MSSAWGRSGDDQNAPGNPGQVPRQDLEGYRVQVGERDIHSATLRGAGRALKDMARQSHLVQIAARGLRRGKLDIAAEDRRRAEPPGGFHQDPRARADIEHALAGAQPALQCKQAELGGRMRARAERRTGANRNSHPSFGSAGAVPRRGQKKTFAECLCGPLCARLGLPVCVRLAALRHHDLR